MLAVILATLAAVIVAAWAVDRAIASRLPPAYVAAIAVLAIAAVSGLVLLGSWAVSG